MGNRDVCGEGNESRKAGNFESNKQCQAFEDAHTLTGYRTLSLGVLNLADDGAGLKSPSAVGEHTSSGLWGRQEAARVLPLLFSIEKAEHQCPGLGPVLAKAGCRGQGWSGRCAGAVLAQTKSRGLGLRQGCAARTRRATCSGLLRILLCLLSLRPSAARGGVLVEPSLRRTQEQLQVSKLGTQLRDLPRVWPLPGSLETAPSRPVSFFRAFSSTL